MKSEQDKFDDAVRKKLQHADIPPPAGMFDEIISHKRKKRGGAYLWLLLLLIPSGMLIVEKNMTETEEITSSFNITSTEFKTAEVVAPDENPSSLQAQNNIHSIAAGADSSLHAENISGTQSAFQNGLHGTAQQGDRGSISSREKSHSVHRRDSRGNRGRLKSNSQAVGKQSQTSLAYGKLPVVYPEMMTMIYPALPRTNPMIERQANPMHFTPAPPAAANLASNSKFSIELSAGLLYSNPSYTAATEDTAASRLISSFDQKLQSDPGIQLEIMATCRISTKWVAGIGLFYSSGKEHAAFDFENYYYSTVVDTTQYYVLFPFAPPLLITEFDTLIVPDSETIPVRHTIQYQSAGVSGIIRYSLPLGRMALEPQLGVTATIFTFIKGSSNVNESFTEQQGSSFADPQFEIRLSGGLGLTYACTEQLGIFIRSGYQQGLNEFMNTENAKVKRNQFSAGIGLQWNFLKKQATKSGAAGSAIVKQ